VNNRRSLQKEGTLFLEEDLKSLIDRVLRIVALYLAEIRIYRRVEHEIVMKDILSVESGFPLKRFRIVDRIRRIAIVDGAEASSENVRDQLKIASRLRIEIF
jgi:hypothetical protein